MARDLENILLSEINLTEKGKYPVKQANSDTERGIGATRGWMEVGRGDLFFNGYRVFIGDDE